MLPARLLCAMTIVNFSSAPRTIRLPAVLHEPRPRSAMARADRQHPQPRACSGEWKFHEVQSLICLHERFHLQSFCRVFSIRHVCRSRGQVARRPPIPRRAGEMGALHAVWAVAQVTRIVYKIVCDHPQEGTRRKFAVHAVSSCTCKSPLLRVMVGTSTWGDECILDPAIINNGGRQSAISRGG